MQDKLAGTWKMDVQGEILFLTLNEDGTCSTRQGGKDDPGRWNLRQKNLELKSDRGPSNVFVVQKIDDQQMHVEIKGGPKLTLEKSKPLSKPKPLQPIWQLTINWGGCEMAATINGFPLGKCDGETGFVSQPINPWLIGKGNVLEIRVTGGDASKASVRASLRVMKRGDIVDTLAPGGDLLLEKPGTLSFDSTPALFGEVLKKAKKLDGPAPAIAFGEKLVQLVGEKNEAELLAILGGRVEHISSAMGGPVEPHEQLCAEFIRDSMFELGLEPVTKEEIDAVPHCDGRVWELKRKNGDRLLRTVEKDDYMDHLAVFASDLGKGFVVVC